ncbi:MAG: hypothetical protein IKL07_02570 [Clostridium sp.]|nr:hypothetical protein [Clostridium sp.]
MDGTAIDYTMLYIPSFDILHIESFKMEQRINEHAVMIFSGLIKDGVDEEQLVMYTNVGYQVEVYCSNDIKNPKQKKMFQGIVTEVKVRNVDTVKYLHVKAYSNSFQMDVIKNSVSYQETSRTYKQMLGEVVKRTNNASVIFSPEFDKPTGGFLIQYKETDWEYLKRMASHFHVGLVPDILSGKPCAWAGYAFSQDSCKIHVKEYTTSKDIKAYQIEKKNGLSDAQEKNYLIYEVKSYNILKVMDKVNFMNQTFYVKKAVYEMVESTIVGTYRICKKEHFKRKKIVNWELSGISLNGLVTEIIRDKIKVQLSIDRESNAKYLFPYSTMSASPDGSGWYCMPRKGDEVRVYFPDEEDRNAFAVSSVSAYTPPAEGGTSGQGAKKDRMGDPNVRYLRTPHGMQITLNPDGIIINAADGQGVIALDAEGNITINAAKDLKVTAKNDINLVAENNIALFATEDLSFTGSQGNVTLKKDGNTVIGGQYIAEN